MLAVAALCAARWTAVALHEGAHAVAAGLCGRKSQISLHWRRGASTIVPGISETLKASKLVAHAGWLFSLVLAIFCYRCWWPVSVAACWTALDGITSDLLGYHSDETSPDRFFCGNFGLVLLDLACAAKVKPLLETMLRVTMMRGAQSAGLVTYTPSAKGIRKRVVNGKRTDLCTMLLREYASQLKPSNLSCPQLFQGHTRFATSSIAALPGCHPHQWTKHVDDARVDDR